MSTPKQNILRLPLIETLVVNIKHRGDIGAGAGRGREITVIIAQSHILEAARMSVNVIESSLCQLHASNQHEEGKIGAVDNESKHAVVVDVCCTQVDAPKSRTAFSEETNTLGRHCRPGQRHGVEPPQSSSESPDPLVRHTAKPMKLHVVEQRSVLDKGVGHIVRQFFGAARLHPHAKPLEVWAVGCDCNEGGVRHLG